MNEIHMPGLDGTNPLGFLAGLGVLNAVSDQRGGDPRPALSWVQAGSWMPVLHAGLDEGELLEALWADLRGWDREPVLDLKYGEDGASVRDLKPPPAVFRAFLQDLIVSATPEERRGVDVAASWATEVAVDNKGNTKPTALHFTAGQQKFLEMVRTLRDEVTRDDLHEALVGPWSYSRALPVLQWDCTMFRDYALRADDPSGAKKLGVPGADWLAFRGLPFIRVAPMGKRAMTTGCVGEWKTGSFHWPLWTHPIERPTVHTVLQLRLAEITDAERLARGISMVFRCAIKRADPGGRGSFAPAAVI